MKTALLLVYGDTHFNELVRVARVLASSGRWQPRFLFSHAYPTLERDLEICRQEGLSVVGASESGGAAGPARRPGLRARVVAGLPTRARAALKAATRTAPDLLVPVSVFGHLRNRTRIRHLLDELRPALLVLAEDHVGLDTPQWIRSCHDAGIPSVIVPFTIANPSEPAEAYSRRMLHRADSLLNRAVARAYPRWVHEHRDLRLVRLPAARVLAHEWLRLAPPRPWMMNSGHADAIAVESEFMHAYYRREGIPESQLVITGALSDDALAASSADAHRLRREVCAEHGLDPGRPLILCALPPDQIGYAPPGLDFDTYEQIVAFWMETLSSLGANVIVRLHPRVRTETMRYIERWGVHISTHDTARLIPICDLYVACVSATIRWAIAAGKPVVNYDVYHYRYHDYDDARGVVTTTDQGEFATVLRRWADDASFRRSFEDRQRADAARWGRLDGQASARMLALFDRLVA